MNTRIVLVALVAGCLVPSASAAVFTAQGSMAGEVTATSALLQTRLTAIPGPALDATGDVPGAAGAVCFEYAVAADFKDARRTDWLEATAANDFIARAHLTNLRAGQVYHYRPVFGADRRQAQPGRPGQFATLPGAASDRAVTFIVCSCMNYNKFMHGARGKASGPITATAEDKRLGFPAFVAMAALQPDFFGGTGDIVYYDNILHGPATTLPQLRALHSHPRFRVLAGLPEIEITPARLN